MSTTAKRSAAAMDSNAEEAAVDAVIARARVAQVHFERTADQAMLDRAALACLLYTSDAADE